jgi:fluoride exporter
VNLLLVVVGALVGAPARYLTDRAVQTRSGARFPGGTLSVNLVACLVLGLVTEGAGAGSVSHHVQLLVGTGFCATLSTYSTFSFETLRLIETGARRAALLNVVLSIGAGLLAAAAGAGLAHAL